MASFKDHIIQSKNNIQFFEEIINNTDKSKYLDWYVTICFYVSVHLINAHIAQKANYHYRSHKDIEDIINPFLKKNSCTLNITIYKSYIKLSMLSRRARYLLDENNGANEIAHYIEDKHFIKAIKNLDSLIHYFCKEYSINDFPVIKITYPNISKLNLQFIQGI